MEGKDEDEEDGRALTMAEAAALPLAGRPFLHVQGRTVTRGRVTALKLTPPHWDLFLAEVDYLNRETGQWERKRETDDYGGQIESDRATLWESGLLTIHGYGMVTHIAPVEGPPSAYADWPETGRFAGGAMPD